MTMTKQSYGAMALSAFLFFSAATAQAQPKFPAPSPGAKVVQDVGLTKVEIDYSRPSMKDRKIFGELVPYGSLWRTGANAATKITFGEQVTIQGKSIPAGTYALLSIPGQNQWTVILNSDAALRGTGEYKEAKDVARFEVKPETLATPTETLSIGLDHLRDDSAVLFIEWDRTRVPLEVKFDTHSKVMSSIEKEMAQGKDLKAGDYANAGFYLYNHKGDLNQALTWMDKAIEMQPDAFYFVHRKALILAALGRKSEAIAEAKKSMEMAKKSPAFAQEYTFRNQELIDSLK